MVDITIELKKIKGEIDELSNKAKTEIEKTLSTTEDNLKSVVKDVFNGLLEKTNNRKLVISVITLLFTIGCFAFQILAKYVNISGQVDSIINDIVNNTSSNN